MLVPRLKSRIPRHLRAGFWTLVLGLLAALLVLNGDRIESGLRGGQASLSGAAISKLDTTAYDWLFNNRGPERLDTDIVIVEINDRAINNLTGEKWHGQDIHFPFPRAMHGALFRTLTAAGAKVIAPDITFPGSSGYGPADDAAFVAALRDCGSVILAADFTQSRSGQVDDLSSADQFPFADLREVAPNFGPVNIPQDSDLAVRRFNLTLPNIALEDTTHDVEYPTFAVRVAGAYLDIPKTTLDTQLSRGIFNGHSLAFAPDAMNDNVPGRTVRIDYPGYPKFGFRYVSYDQALSGRFAPGLFRNKIVLIGSTVSGEHTDEQATPLMRDTQEEAKRPGVEIQASIVHTLISGRTIAMFPSFARKALIFLVALLAAAFTLRYHPLKAAPLIVLLVIGIVLLSTAFFSVHIFLRPTRPIASGLLSFGFQSIYYYAVENRRANEIRRRFGRYLGPRVLEKVMEAETLTLTAERAVVTVMFTDLQGFTSLSEKMAPSDAVGMLNEYSTQMVEIIDRHKGTLDKIMGDGIMAYFNAPFPVEAHEQKAVLAALEMQAMMVAWRAKCEEMGVPPLRVRIGIHVGEVVVGNMGAERQMSYTIIGDTVNTAARLEPLNKEYGTEILISEAVQKELSPDIPTQFVGEIAIRGRKEGLRAYSVSAS